MIRKSKLIYGIGSAVIGIVVIIFVFAGLVLSGVIDAETRKLVFESASKEMLYDGQDFVCDEWSLVEGELKQGHKAQVKVYGKQTGVGVSENHMSVTILDMNGADVTGDYEIVCETGTLSVTSRPLTVGTGSIQREYDGTALKSEQYEITSGTLADGHELSVTTTGSQTDAGESNNTAIATVVDENGNDVTSNYALTVETGVLTVAPRKISLSSADGSKVYDGQPLTKEGYKLQSGSLVDGHAFVPTYIGTITNVGQTENTFEVVVENADGVPVSYNYDVEYYYGILEVTPREIFIKTDSDMKVYDGEPLRAPGYTFVRGETVASHTLEVTCTGEQTDAGETLNNAIWSITDENGALVNTNYVVDVTKGTLTVQQRPLQLFSEGRTFTYDGTAQSHNSAWYSGEVAPNQYLSCQCLTTITNVNEGPKKNEITWTVTDFNGVDVSKNYLVTKTCGELIMNPREFEITTEGQTWVYDGQPHSLDSAWVSNHNLMWNHSIDLRCETTVQNVKDGKVDNKPTWTIWNEYGVNVSENYKAIEKCGTLEITPREFTITTKGQTWIYDGEEHSHNEYDYSKYELVWGHYADVHCNTSVKNVKDGKVENKPTWTIWNEFGVNVSENYKAIEKCGTLEIAPREFTITTKGQTWIYDGEEHSYNEYDYTDYNLVWGHYAEINCYATVKNVKDGKVENKPTWTITDENGVNVSENYKAIEIYGELKITPYKVTITTGSGSWEYDGQAHSYNSASHSGVLWNQTMDLRCDTEITNVKEGPKENTPTWTVWDSNWVDVSDNYEVVEDYGTLEITPREFTITTEGQTWTYDGQPHSHNGYDHTWNFVNWDYPTITCETLITNVKDGPVDNKPTWFVTDGHGNDVSSNYKAIEICGKLAIKPREFEITTAGQTWVYDGNEHFYDSARITNDTLLWNHSINLRCETVITNVSKSVVLNKPTWTIWDDYGNDVSENYKAIEKCGELKIAPRTFTITTEGQTWVYDGEVHSLDSAWVTNDTLLWNHSIDLHCYTEVKNVKDGKVDNKPTWTITDENGVNVSENYKAVEICGKLEITPYKVTITTGSESWLYDGQAHGNYSASHSGVLWNQTMDLRCDTEITNVKEGPKENTPTWTVWDSNWVDVSDNYEVVEDYGTLEITPREFTITTAGQTWVYDGQPHSYNGYDNTWNFVNWDYPTITCETLITNVKDGPVDNKPTWFVTDGYGNDVSTNYKAIEICGKLEITPREFEITTDGYTWTYDGNEHFYDSARITNDTLLWNHSIVYHCATTVKNVKDGKVDNKPTWTITDENGVNVSENYNAIKICGKLEIMPREFEITTDGYTWTYDGNEHFYDSARITNDTLLWNHSIDYHCATTVQNVKDGKVNNKPTWTITDENGVNVSENYKAVEICGKLEIMPREFTITTGSESWTYDGQVHSNNESWYSDYDLVGGHSAEINCYTEVKNVKDGKVNNKPTWTITDENGVNVSENYKAVEICGKLEITPRAFTITTGSESWTYDGQAHSNNESWCSEYDLVSGHSVTVEHHVTVTNVKDGKVDNKPTWIITDENGVNVSENYKATENCGKLEITPREFTIVTEGKTWVYDGQSHSLNEAVSSGVLSNHEIAIHCYTEVKNVTKQPVENVPTWTITDENGVNVSENYNATEICGKLEITPREITITTEGKTWEYDGQSHSLNEAVPSGVLSNHEIAIHCYAEVKNVADGAVDNKPTWTITDENGVNVSSNYNAIEICGTLRITPRALTIVTEGKTWAYDGKAHTHDGIVRCDGVVSGHNFVGECLVSVKDVRDGVKKNEVTWNITDENGENVSANYEATQVNGDLRILPVSLFAQSADASKRYDGTPLTRKSVWIVNEDRLPDGHTFEFVAETSITNVGTRDNEFVPFIKNEDNEDVTDNFEIEPIYGLLEVTPIPIWFVTGSHEKIYDGYPLDVDLKAHCKLHTDALLSGHTYELTQLPTQDLVSVLQTTQNKFVIVTIYDASHEDVTKNYDVSYEYGMLTIKKRPITIQSQSATKEYDGLPLTCNEYLDDFGRYGLAQGHSEYVRVTGSRTEVGESVNDIFEALIFDGGGIDVTSNYDVKLLEGTLIVKGKVQGGNGSGNGEDGNNGSPSDTGIGLPENVDLDTPIAKVTATADGKAYLRQQSFGAYTGRNWLAATEYTELLNGGYSMNYLSGIAAENSGIARQSMQIEFLVAGDYMLPYHVDNSYLYYETQSSDVRFSGLTSAKYAAYYYPYDYVKDSGIFANRLGEYASAEILYRTFVEGQYTALPTSTRAYMDSIIAQKGWTKNTANIVEKVATFIQNSASYSMEYDRNLDNEEDIYVSFLRDYKQGICQHYAGAATLLYRALGIPARYTVGYTTTTKANEPVTVKSGQGHAWVEVYINGIGWMQVEVTGGAGSNGIGGEDGNNPNEEQEDDPNELQITAKTWSKMYNGTPLTTNNAVTYCNDTAKLLARGYRYEATVEGSQTEVGRSYAVIKSFRLYDDKGKDVTDDYKINLKSGTLHVYLYELYVTTDGATAVYNGQPLTSAGYSYSGLQSGHSIKVETTGKQTTVGNSSNNCTVKVFAENGDDVTVEYNVHKTLGKLTVQQLEITVTAGSASKPYDGKPLETSSYVVTGNVVSTHLVEVKVVGSQTNVGGKVNKIQEVVINDENGKDVTGNYKINIVNGTLTVTPPQT